MTDYASLRTLYYFGILNLVVYALPAIPLVKEFLHPIYNMDLLPGMPVISAIAIATGIAAFLAYQYRKIG